MRHTIDEKDVERLVENGVLEVTREMILIPSAREYAARKGYRLKYLEDKASPQQPLDGDALGKLIEEVVVSELVQTATRQQEEVVIEPPAPLAETDQIGNFDRVHTGIMDELEKESEAGRAVIAVIGANRPGIVARISAVVAELGGDLADMNQVIVDDYFSLIFLVKLEGILAKGVSFRIFKERLNDEASKFGQMEVIVMHEKIFKSMHKV